MANFLAPGDLSKALVGVGVKKAAIPPAKMLLLGILAGVYIGFAAHLATTIATGPCAWFGLKKFLIGAVFSCGLMLVIIPGSELWTGNCLMGVALIDRKIGIDGLLKNWIIVYIGNLIGSIFLAWMIAQMSGLANGPVGATMIKIAAAKTGAAEGHNVQFFFRAIGCNWLVCLAVMMAVSAQDIGGKVWGIFFPIMAFVASGFEHAIANMYFIPAGIFAKTSPKAIEATGKTLADFNGLNWGTMWSNNLITVTLGNFVGGFILTAGVYWFLFVKGSEEAK